MNISLFEIGDSYLAEEIKKIALLLSKKIPTRKAEILSFIAEKLSKEDTVVQYWNCLDELQKAAVSEALYSPPFEPQKFKLKYGSLPQYARPHSGNRQTPTYLNLFIFDDHVPKELARHVRKIVPRPQKDTIQTVSSITDSGGRDYETERSALSDVKMILHLIEQNKITVSEKTKLPTKTSIKKIWERLEGGDFFPPEEKKTEWAQVPGPVKAFAWPVIAQAGGLAGTRGTKLELTDAGKTALHDKPENTIDLLLKKWVPFGTIDEFSRIDTIKGQKGKGRRYFSSPESRRMTIMSALREAPVHSWIAVDEFSRYMRANDFDFFVTSDRWSLYVCDTRYGSLGYDGFGTWDIIEKRYILVFLMEYLATLGIVDVYYSDPREIVRDFTDLWGMDELEFLSRYDGLTHFRINNLGAWCLDLASEYMSPLEDTGAALTVMSNFDVVVHQEMIMSEKLFLERFTRKESDRVYVLEKDAILRAVEQGLTVDKMTGFLTRKSKKDLPETVSVFFTDIRGRVNDFRKNGNAVIVEAKDSETAKMVILDPQLKKHCLYAEDRFIVVPEEEETFFINKMRDRGYVIL
jgi:hypothetical protein